MPRHTQVPPRRRGGYVVACTGDRCSWARWRRADSRYEARQQPCPQCGHEVKPVRYEHRTLRGRRR